MHFKKDDKQLMFFGSNHIETFKQEWEWSTFDFSLDNLRDIFKSITHKELDLEVYYWDNEWVSANYHRSILNDMMRSSILFRDVYAAKKILESLEKYNRVFVIMGGMHAYSQEPVFKECFGV